MAWVLIPWRGVALVGGVVLSFRLAVRFLSVRGAGSFSWFFHMELLGGLFEEEWVVCLRRDERRRTK